MIHLTRGKQCFHRLLEDSGDGPARQGIAAPAVHIADNGGPGETGGFRQSIGIMASHFRQALEEIHLLRVEEFFLGINFTHAKIAFLFIPLSLGRGLG